MSAERREQQRRGALFAAVVDAATDAIIVTDLDGYIVHWNAAAAGGTGRDPEAVRGLRINGFGGVERAGDIDALLDEVRRTGAARNFDVQWLDRSGQPVDLDVAVSAVYDDDGEPFQALFVIRDVTPQRRAARAVEDANERLRAHADELAAVNERLSKFANSLSHDLHQPLFALGGFLELLAESGDLGEEDRELAARAYANHLALVAAVDDLREAVVPGDEPVVS